MQSRKKQSGAVLIVGIVMLLILSIIVIAGSKSTIMQQKMTSNLRDKELSFQAAETAINTGENLIKGLTIEQIKRTVFDGTNGYYTYDKNRSLSDDNNWDNLNTRNSNTGLHQVKETPKYIVESITGIHAPGKSLQVPKVVDSYYFRITAKGKGGTNNASTIVQTIFKK